MIKPPCIRGLVKFKKGCPKKCWDGETGEGCPAWVSCILPDINDKNKPKQFEMCIDTWNVELKLRQLGLLEGNAIGLEELKNGLLFIDNGGKVGPKADPALIEILKMVNHLKDVQQIKHQYQSEIEDEPIKITNS
jgi:hypothetical protein